MLFKVGLKMKIEDYDFSNEEINKISDKYSSVYCAFLTGESYRDIAYNFGIPIGTVRSRIYRAKKQLVENRVAKSKCAN